MKRRMFFLTAGSGGGTSQTTGQQTNQTQTTIGEGQQQTSNANQTNQTQNTQTQNTNNSQTQTQNTGTNQTQTTTGEGQQQTSNANQTQNTQTQNTNNSQTQTQIQNTGTNQVQTTTGEGQQQKYVSLDEVQKMIAENNKSFEKRDLINEISQNANLKGLLDKKFPKWNEKPLEEIKNIKTVYEGIVQSQLVSGASEKPGNVSTQNSDVFISTGNASKDYENFCKFKREQKKKQQSTQTQTTSALDAGPLR